MDEIVKRLIKLRKNRGISHDAMAVNLNLSQAAYSKIEKGETKLSVERLFNIAEILETNVAELLGIESTYNQEIKENENFTAIAHQQVENLYQENKAFTDKLVKHLEESLLTKDKLIALLEEKLGKMG